MIISWMALFLVAVMVLSVILLVSTRLLKQLESIHKSSERIDYESIQADGVITSLRSDVWRANSIKGNQNSLAIDTNDHVIEWSIEKDQIVRRAELWTGESSITFANLIKESKR